MLDASRWAKLAKSAKLVPPIDFKHAPRSPLSKADLNRRANLISMLQSLKRSISQCATRVPRSTPIRPPERAICLTRGSKRGPDHSQWTPRASQSSPSASPARPSRPPVSSQSAPVGAQSVSVDSQCPAWGTPIDPYRAPVAISRQSIEPFEGQSKIRHGPKCDLKGNRGVDRSN